VKIYCENEIERVKGFDNFRHPFMNELSESLAKDELAKDGHNKTEIAWAVDFEWRLCMCELLF
jgi:hypothetical protein